VDELSKDQVRRLWFAIGVLLTLAVGIWGLIAYGYWRWW